MDLKTCEGMYKSQRPGLLHGEGAKDISSVLSNFASFEVGTCQQVGFTWPASDIG